MREPLHISEFDYLLPEDRIAQTPVEPRDSARLLVDRGSQKPDHLRVADLADLLGPGDVLVVNETKVLPVRLRLQRATGGAVEVLLLEPTNSERRLWEGLARPGRKLRPGDVLGDSQGSPVLKVLRRMPSGDTFEYELLSGAADSDHCESDRVQNDPLAVLERHGEMPLPPYITEKLVDIGRYQTVYAASPGSAAAPTAGLHFTHQLLEQIRSRGVRIEPVELVVGLDTFRPMTTDDPREHPMHTERYHVPKSTWEACQQAKRVIAVGTTAVRALESAAVTGKLEGRTDLMISRGHDWRVVDLMMTNFHLPRTTLLVMIDAFIGSRWKDLYEEALTQGYRFLSFGDAMLLNRSFV
jgi:S-adenosylmethionine:tRNA ribosyltransferase-isomerase